MTNTDGKSGSLIADDMVINGDVSFEGRLQINGTIKGSLRGDVAGLGRQATLEGEIFLRDLDCHGTVHGHLASARLVLQKTAAVSATVSARELDMAPGAAMSGMLTVSATLEEACFNGGRAGAGAAIPAAIPDAGSVSAGGPAPDGEPPPALESEDVPLLESLVATVYGGSGLVLVISDQTRRREQLIEQLRQVLREACEVVFLDDPGGSVRDVLLRLAAALKVRPADYSDHAGIMAELVDALRSRSPGRPIVLLFDHGEKMYPATLEGVTHHISGTHADGGSAVQLVIFGGSDLKTMMDLEAPEFREREPDCIFEL